MDKNCPQDCHKKKCPVIFDKVVIPASIDDDSKNPPKNGAYCNKVVEYEATGNVYIYSSDGIPTKVSADLGDIDEKIATAVGEEAEERIAADNAIWDEIETIEAGSDVVDVVGTYAELQQYDTSTLQNGDIIKVLADETRSGAITYYRWDATTQAFTYVGSEGPYYTASETDTLLAGKQDKLIAGNNIQIATDGKTISATDTTYGVFSTGSNGLVPGPTAGDTDKYLKSDGTWQTVQSGGAQTIFYMNASESGATRHLYKSSDMTGLATMQDIIDANEEGQVIVRISTAVDPTSYSDMYLQNAYVATGDYQMIFLDNRFYYGFDTTSTSDNTFSFSKRELQDKLAAGTNVQINGNTISATDTTYTHFTGATALADGTQGLVPGPLAGDQDKFLKADGTWATVQAGGSTRSVFYYDGMSNFYKDAGLTDSATAQDILEALESGTTFIKFKDTAMGVEDKYVQVISYHSDSSRLYIQGITCTNSSNKEGAYIRFEQYANQERWNLLTPGIQSRLTAGSNISISTVGGVPNTISVTGMPVLYGSQGQNTDGAVTQKLFTDTVGDVESILQILNSGSGV